MVTSFCVIFRKFTIRMKAFLLLIGFFLTYIHLASAGIGESDAMDYLRKYGYMDMNLEASLPMPDHLTGRTYSEPLPMTSRLTTKTLREAIADFQRFNNLNVTGELNEETRELMLLPRCGVADVIARRSKRYSLQGSRWHKKKLTYKIMSYPRGMSKEDVDKEIGRAFKIWTRYADIEIDPVSKGKRADFNVKFEYRNHGDSDPFDGPGGTLAHAAFPVYGGDIHFDASEPWTKNSYRGINLYQTAVHEIGHALGLEHTRTRRSVMVPYYTGYSRVFHLYQDDIDAIQLLYGKKVTKDMDKNTSKFGSEKLCENTKIDAIFMDNSDKLHVFKNQQYWILKNGSMEMGYPRNISDDWGGLPSKIDTAFYSKNGKVYFFKGSQYWKFEGRQLAEYYPRAISKGFTGIPDNIDGVAEYNNVKYFFKDGFFWEYDSKAKISKASKPQIMSLKWKHLPSHIDGAFTIKNKTFVYKGDSYYELFATSTSDEPKWKYSRWNYLPHNFNDFFGNDIMTPDININKYSTTNSYNDEKSFLFPKSVRFWLLKCSNVSADIPFPPHNDDHNEKDTVEKTAKEDNDEVCTEKNAGHNHRNTTKGLSNALICDYPKPDAIFKGSNNITYVFQNTRYWALNNNAVLKSYPKNISSHWPGISGCIDAAYTDQHHNTFIFKGSQYWKYNYQGLPYSKNPQTIEKGFPGIPDNVDAAFSLSNGTTYFFKGALFWKFNPSQKSPVGFDYPQAISDVWKNVPNYLDAAHCSSDDDIYFFKDDKYYRWDNAIGAVNSSYPKSIKDEWYGCSAKTCVDTKAGGTKFGTDKFENKTVGLCENTEIDAIFTTSSGSKYILRGSMYWRIEADGYISPEYPKPISTKWPELPENIQAAFAGEQDSVYFFKGDQYWIYENGAMKTSFPKKITSGFPGVPINLDAALYWKHIYFFKGNKFWVIKALGKQLTSPSYPKLISDFSDGVPNNIKTAYTDSDDLYFLKDNFYYKVEKPFAAFWGSRSPKKGPIEDIFGCKKSKTIVIR